MAQHFTIGGDRKLDIAVTVGVKDVETLDGLRWLWVLCSGLSWGPSPSLAF